MPPKFIALDDCTFDKSDGRISLVLPATIELSGIRPLTGTIIGDYHNHYPNSYGDLVIACDHVARYFHPKDRISRLRSEHGWPEDKGSRFYFDNPTDIVPRLDRIQRRNGKDTVAAIPELSDLTESFLMWVNEFGLLYGERHLYVI